jgi:serine/threonine-protein kinase ATR
VSEQYTGLDDDISQRVKAEVGESWLRSAKIARKAGQLQEAFSFLLEAQKYESPKVFLEAAKLNWERGFRTQAITVLRKGLQATFPDVMKALETLEPNLPEASQLGRALEELGQGHLRELCAQAKLLLARYVEEAASVSNENVKKYFDHAKELSKTSDEIFYHQAKFFDKQCQKMTPEQMINQSEVVTHAALIYLRSLRCGPSYLDECMPRLLTIWLDFAENIHEASFSKDKDPKSIAALHNASTQLSKLNRSIYITRTKMPAYYFLTAFPQIVSRICHPHEETYNVLRSLMITVFLKFPQQAFWHMVCVSKNREQKRQTRCSQVFKEATAQSQELGPFLADAILFSKKIDELCDKKTEDRQMVTSFRDLLPSFLGLFNQRQMSPLILPIQRNMVVTCPTAEANLSCYNPFPAGVVTIVGVEDEIQVMMSLVRPKKITLRGSDGRLYPFLAKPKDDLRRDCRLMDLACLLNRMFRKEPEARKRDLMVRTYTVVPTNETSGLIEWIGNLKGLRQIINQLLKERGCNLITLQRGHTPDPKKDSLEKKKECLRRCIEEQRIGEPSASVFREWFVRTFPDPQVPQPKCIEVRNIIQCFTIK